MVALKTRTEDPVQTPGPAPEISQVDPSKSESLSDLAKEADAMENKSAQTTETPTAVEVVGPDTSADELADLLKLARDMAAPLVEAMGYLRPGQTKEIWSDAVLKSIAAPAIDIMRRFDVGLEEALEKIGPYLGLLIGLYAPSIATWTAIKQNAALINAAKNDSQQQQQPA